MNISKNEWQEIVQRASVLNAEIAEADVNDIWSYGQARPGASDADIVRLEQRLQCSLGLDYRNLLSTTDGWRGFYHDVDLLACSENPDGGRARRAWEIADAAVSGSGGVIDIARRAYIPIGVSEFDIDAFFLDLNEWSVRWIAGVEVENFPSVRDFFEGMVMHNRATLEELRADPWLGAGS